MDTLKKKLEKLEKPELIAIIQHMLRQAPDLNGCWLHHSQEKKIT